jgi:hypothetical protein
VLAHARRFFADFAVPADVKTVEGTDVEATDADPVKTAIEQGDGSLRDYFCYLMLDFVTVDRDLGDVALSAALVLSRRLGIDRRFAELAQNELAIGKKAFAKIDKDADAILARTEAAQAT